MVGRVPANYDLAHHTTVINPVPERREYVQVAEPTQYITASQYVTHSPVVVQEPVYTEPMQYQVVADQYFPDGTPNLFRTFQTPVLTEYV